MNTEKIIIIGAGPAGLAAAQQLKLYGIDPLVIESDQPGGLLLNANSVINYPGVLQGISGKELVKMFPLPKQLIIAEVTSIYKESSFYVINSARGTLKTSTVIVASGTTPTKIKLQRIPENRIHYEVKNLNEISGKTVAIIGGGDAALDYAMTLSKKNIVNVYARGDFSKVVTHLMEKVQTVKNITLHPGKLPENQVFLEDLIIVAIGRKARLDFISEKLLSSPPKDGSFHLCGDCKNGIYRQTAIAVGNGVEAAMKTAEYLRKVETYK